MLLRQLVPAVVICFFFVSKMVNNKAVSTVFVLGSSLVLMASFPKPYVARLWIAYCLVVYSYACHVSGDHVFAACYAILSAHFGGWLYEVPFWHPSTMFYSTRYPWLVNTQILSGVFCAWLLKKREIKVNKTMLSAILVYVATSAPFILFKPTNYDFWGFGFGLWWLPRVGVMFLLGSIISGIVGEKQK